MKTFRLGDGTEYQVNNESNRDFITLTCETAVAESLIEKLTVDNLKTATIGDESMLNMVYEGFNASPVDEITNEIYVSLSFRGKRDMEIINERLDEQDAALMELAELIVG